MLNYRAASCDERMNALAMVDSVVVARSYVLASSFSSYKVAGMGRVVVQSYRSKRSRTLLQWDPHKTGFLTKMYFLQIENPYRVEILTAFGSLGSLQSWISTKFFIELSSHSDYSDLCTFHLTK